MTHLWQDRGPGELWAPPMVRGPQATYRALWWQDDLMRSCALPCGTSPQSHICHQCPLHATCFPSWDSPVEPQGAGLDPRVCLPWVSCLGWGPPASHQGVLIPKPRLTFQGGPWDTWSQWLLGVQHMKRTLKGKDASHPGASWVACSQATSEQMCLSSRYPPAACATFRPLTWHPSLGKGGKARHLSCPGPCCGGFRKLVVIA